MPMEEPIRLTRAPIAANVPNVPWVFKSSMTNPTTGVLGLASITEAVKSPNALTNTSTQPVMRPGRINGKATLLKVRPRLARDIRLASVMVGPIWLREFSALINARGIYIMIYAMRRSPKIGVKRGGAANVANKATAITTCDNDAGSFVTASTMTEIGCF